MEYVQADWTFVSGNFSRFEQLVSAIWEDVVKLGLGGENSS